MNEVREEEKSNARCNGDDIESPQRWQKELCFCLCGFHPLYSCLLARWYLSETIKVCAVPIYVSYQR